MKYAYYNMFLYLMKILFIKSYYLNHIYFNLNRIFITEQCMEYRSRIDI
ncbi:hypothetical protein, partial [Plasmodium yoelii yoelii]